MGDPEITRSHDESVPAPMSPGGTVDLDKIPKLCFEGERSWKRGLRCSRQMTAQLPVSDHPLGSAASPGNRSQCRHNGTDKRTLSHIVYRLSQRFNIFVMQGPALIFDKSSLQILTVDEAVLLDNFYRSNIVPIFFVECLADLEKEMVKMKCTPEQFVGSLATKTPDSQSSANVYHLEILKGELSGQFDLDTVLLRPLVPKGQHLQLGDSQGMIFQASQEEEAVHRWARREFLNLEREIAKGWRRMISQIDLDAMSKRVLDAIGPWRKPKSLQDARAMTDTIIDNLDPEWLLRFGLQILGVSEATEFVIKDWKDNRQKPIREYRPYFIHMLSINIFFSLVLPTQLLKKVKPSHHIDLAYLYYLPFCTVFTSRDNFHVEVAPLFMSPAQQFVHGDALKADLKRLNEHYLQLPEEVLEQGLYTFAQFPPDDSSYLTTRLWDAYLPNWRSASPNKVDVPPQIQEALKGLIDKYRNKSKPVPGDRNVSIGELDFVEISKKVSPAKGSYLRFSRDVILKNHEEEMKKRNEVFPPGTQFQRLVESLTDLFNEPYISSVEVIFISFKLDGNGEKVIEDNQHVAQIRAVAITGISSETRETLKEQYEVAPLISLLVLWTRPSSEKLGILKFCPVTPDNSSPEAREYEDWERKAIDAYIHRNNL
jgi:hypothetical protein